MYAVSKIEDRRPHPAACGGKLGRPSSSQAGTRAAVATNADAKLARSKVTSGSPLTLTSTFHVPWIAAAARARAIAAPTIYGRLGRARSRPKSLYTSGFTTNPLWVPQTGRAGMSG